jgi:hypothetical protein
MSTADEEMQLILNLGSQGNNQPEEKTSFVQHDDPDVVIPDRIARYLLLSSNLLLTTAIVAACYGRYGLFAVIFALYLTSIWHWHRPRFSSWARKFDYIAVLTALSYGSYVATTVGIKYELVWFCGLGLVAMIFISNEVSHKSVLSRKLYSVSHPALPPPFSYFLIA